MEKQYSVQFFTSFVENLQRLCQNYINYDQMVEVSGYISVEIDNAKKERYVLSEMVQSTGNVISESYCTKVFKNCPLPLQQRSPSTQQRDRPQMSQQSPVAKRPLGTQSSPQMNRMGRSPQMSRQMSPSGPMRPNNDSNKPGFGGQRPSSFNQRLNQSSGFSGGRGSGPRMSSNFGGGGGGQSGGPRYGQPGRPGMQQGNSSMMSPAQRMNQPRPGQMAQRNPNDPNQRIGPQSIQARKSFGPVGQKQPPPPPKAEENDPDELEVISFVPAPTRRGAREPSTSSLSSGTRSPATPESSASSSNTRPQFPTSAPRPGSNSNNNSTSMQQQQNSSQIQPMPVSIVPNIAQQQSQPQMSRNQGQQMQNQDYNRPQMQTNSQVSNASMSQVSQADSRQQMGGQNYQQNQQAPQQSQASDSSQSQPTRQQIVQQMLQARANRNINIPPSLQSQNATPTSQPNQQVTSQNQPQPMQQQQQQQQQKPQAVPQQVYQNQNFNQSPMQPPNTPPAQIMPANLQDNRNIWDDLNQQEGNFPQASDKKDQGILGSLNLPSLDSSVDSSGPMEISARKTTFMETVEDKKSLAVSSSALPVTVTSSSHLSFPEDPLGSLQISNVVSLPQDKLPTLTHIDNLATSQASSGFADLSESAPSLIAEAFASLDDVTLQDAAASLNTPTSEMSVSLPADTNMDEGGPAKKPRLGGDQGDTGSGPTSTSKLNIPIGRKIKEFAAKKRAKRGRPPRQEKAAPKPENDESDDEEHPEFEHPDISVGPAPNSPIDRNLRSQGRTRRVYNESSDSESSLPDFGLSFESTVTTSAGLVLAGDGDEEEEKKKDSGGGGGKETAPAQLDTGSEKKAASQAESRRSPDNITEAENESYVIIELESDDDDGPGSSSADSSTPIIKQELSTFTKPVQFAINRLTQFMILKKVKESAYSIFPDQLDPLLAEFYLRLRKSDGQEFIASSLKQIQNCISTYLTTNGYPYDIKIDPKFEKSRKTLENKLRHLRSREDAIFTVRSEDVDKMYEIRQLGPSSAESLINTMWLMNTIHFSIRKPRDHISLKWGDVKIGRENNQEYIEHIPSGKIVWKNQENPSRCFVTLYKKYRLMRPPTAQSAGSHFYLAATDKGDSLRHHKYGGQAMASIFKRMLTAAELPPAMKISNLDIL